MRIVPKKQYWVEKWWQCAHSPWMDHWTSTNKQWFKIGTRGTEKSRILGSGLAQERTISVARRMREDGQYQHHWQWYSPWTSITGHAGLTTHTSTIDDDDHTHHGPVPLVMLDQISTLLLLLPHVLDHQGRTQPVGCHLEILQYICILYFLYSKYRDFKMHLSSIEWLHCSEIVTHRVPVPVSNIDFNLQFIYPCNIDIYPCNIDIYPCNIDIYPCNIDFNLQFTFIILKFKWTGMVISLYDKQRNLALQVRDA